MENNELEKRVLNVESLAVSAIAQVIEMQKQTKSIQEQQDELIVFTKGFTDKLIGTLDEIRKMGQKNSDWAKEFHRLLINEYAQYPSATKAFGMLYVKVDDRNVRRLILTTANEFQRAQQIGEEILKREGEVPNKWLIEGWQQIDIPDVKEDVVQKVDEKMLNPQKPLGVFINDLNLIRDKYTSSPAERTTLSKIIKRIQTQFSK